MNCERMNWSGPSGGVISAAVTCRESTLNCPMTASPVISVPLLKSFHTIREVDALPSVSATSLANRTTPEALARIYPWPEDVTV